MGCWTVDPQAAPPPFGGDYPFSAPPPEDRGVLADFSLHHAVAARPPLRLIWALGLDEAVNCGLPGPASPDGAPAAAHPADVVVADADGVVVLDTTTLPGALYARADGPGFASHTWAASGFACRLVQRTVAFDPALAAALPAAWRPRDGRLDARCCERIAPRLDALAGRAGAVTLAGGYNVALAAAARVEGLRRVTRVTIAAAPGGGLGRAPGCGAAADPALRTINGRGPDAGGNFALAADACYWVRPPVRQAWLPGQARLGDRVEAVVPAALAVGNDCTPCCRCDDFASIQAAVLRVWGRLEADADRLRDLVALHESNLARWRAQKSCRERQSIHMNALPAAPYVEVAASICNSTPHCLFDARLDVAVATAPERPLTLAPHASTRTDGRGGVEAYDPAFDGATVSFFWDALPPQAAVAGRFRLALGMPAGGGGVGVTLAAAGAVAGKALPGRATRSVMVTP